MLNNDVIENSGNSIRYLGVNLIVKRGLLIVDVNDRIRKFNAWAYDVLINSADLSEVVICQLMVTKCLLILLYGIGRVIIDNEASYKLYVAYWKIFKYNFK